MDLGSLLLGLALGAAVGALAAALSSARANARLREQLAAARTELTALGETAARQRESFVALSTDVLQGSQRSFLELVRPVETALKQVDEQLRAIEREREGAYRELRSQVASMGQASERLRTETATLAQALRAPHTRGRWGEIHLKRVVELAGMRAHCDFLEQATIAGEGGTIRPDMVVKLPGGKSLVVDAKVPLTAYLEAQEATDDATRDRKLGEHLRHFRDHVLRLSQKSYADQFDESPEFVVLFIPGEAFFSAAVNRDPELLEFAFGRGVVPASPTNLVALLKTVHFAWTQEKVAENAERIRDLGADLYDRLVTMTGHMKDLGASLERAVRSYKETMASFDNRVLVSARKMKELGAGSSKEIPTVVSE
ncbi:MAG TPA: DNA recombination protein RmuC [Candidatus Polarisedimenticolaceae bacterium]|nr:DNA recombination protein RmuC [Candidatus Polarisedimenticolaceae bacterium]